ncbi:hypothetical protein BRC95_04500 [Halobacteriales archaeon QS_5_68_33]|nr:MAG: hypothetical protein BRC95_04500 [Halobacteriales archaeon QS_5_68_33]
MTGDDSTTDGPTNGADDHGDTLSADGGTADATTAETDAAESTAAEPGAGSEDRTTGERLAWVVQVGALVVLSLVALLATFRFYFAASEAITVWIADDYVLVFQAAFNLLVLVVCLYSVSLLVRRLG